MTHIREDAKHEKQVIDDKLGDLCVDIKIKAKFVTLDAIQQQIEHTRSVWWQTRNSQTIGDATRKRLMAEWRNAYLSKRKAYSELLEAWSINP